MALQELCLLLVCAFTWFVCGQMRDILHMEEGETVIFRCVLGDNNFTFPEWRSLSSIVIVNQNSSTINANLSADFRNRILQSTNKRDLILSDVRVSDAGDYQCYYTEKGNLTITLSVSRTPGNSFPWWGIFLIIMLIIGLYVIGILVGSVKYCGDKSVFKYKLIVKTGKVHDTVTFVFTLKEDIDVTWSYDSNLRNRSWRHIFEKDGLYLTLKIRNIHTCDAGIYSVEIENETAEAQLEVDSEPWEVYLHKHPTFGFGIDVDDTGCIFNIRSGSPADRSRKIEVGDRILIGETLSPCEMKGFLENNNHVKLELQETTAATNSSIENERILIYGESVAVEDLNTLLVDKWLNDKVIDVYLKLLANRRGVFTLPSCIGPLWTNEFRDSHKFENVTLGTYQQILMPWCVNSHWVLLVADVQEKTVGVLDSLNGDNSEIISKFCEFMVRRGTFCESDLADGWVTGNLESSKQNDECSCGVFVLMNATCIVYGIDPILMCQENVNSFREYVRNRLIEEGVPCSIN